MKPHCTWGTPKNIFNFCYVGVITFVKNREDLLLFAFVVKGTEITYWGKVHETLWKYKANPIRIVSVSSYSSSSGEVLSSGDSCFAVGHMASNKNS